MKYVFRKLIQSPMFTVAALVALAVGIGANIAIFSVVYGILLKPLPYSEPDRLVGVWESAPGLNVKSLNASPSSYFTFREENHSFTDIGVWQSDTASVTGLGDPEHVQTLNITAGLLPVLAVTPELGRWFSEQEDLPDQAKTAVLSYGYWQRRFGGDRGVIGKRMVVDGKGTQIIGVLPQNFHFMNQNPAMVLPLQFNRAKSFVGNFSFQAIARLKPGATLASANADVARMLPLLAKKFPLAPGMSQQIFEQLRLGSDVHPLRQDVVGDIGGILWMVMATVGVVLLIACANVANLLLVRAEGRQQEFAVRTALGADRFDLARELMTESLTLAFLGGALGLALALAGVRLLISIGPANLPRLDEIAIDPTVMLFTLTITLFAGVLFGLIPAWKYAFSRMAASLREGGRTLSESRERNRARGILVVVQVALALVLLVSSGLMIRTLGAMRSVHPGFTDPGRIQTFRISLPESWSAERTVRTFHDLTDKLAAIPGVESVGLANGITMDQSFNNDPLFAESRTYRDGELPKLRRYRFIGPNSFHTMGNALVAGRDITWEEAHRGRNVLLVSQNIARELWGSPAAALGKRVRETPTGVWHEVVGVVGDEYDDGCGKPPTEIVYWPLYIPNFWGQGERVSHTMAISMRTSRAGSSALMKQVQQALWSINPDVPLADVHTVKQIYDKSMARTSFAMLLLAIAAGVALVLGVVGIYGVISYAVSRRTKEIGIRMALGAPKNEVQRMFVRQGLVLSGIGVVCGLAVSLALTRAMSALLYGVSPLDPLTFGAVPAILVLSALLASYLPARRATGIDPLEALRAE